MQLYLNPLSSVRNYNLKIRIGSIVIRCYEFDKMMKFWQDALGYVLVRPESGGFVILCDPEGKGPNLSLDRTHERRRGKRSWLHLDLYADDQQEEVERLVKLGAVRYPWRYEPEADYVVLEDPDGNLFCVVQA
jgi:catechol 2,3-dioxygenase-like lactoylglutathione lyase family enzyme